ncbi:uncharacterized protein PGTG_20256 [Puccinia graminis f. sp. tritici CRL 75-36-700-3]|uniref:Uncharacterized protein n=1 Tax=Puccinia graminis f. sp. tritici (strain CRL 75-36-700-3 / race SCCL) TaxID=418459 RepID=E3NXK3_PUCGT|nr:uncharacterized protein PGTG_20256 [Puccinia graminis f. sp. tritici CRL 75-36-700-3]EFP94302.2 hypothetical protein PGTG_20256 [Puccinia graminis f. sp. tritici CRL 75-36-700-3]
MINCLGLVPSTYKPDCRALSLTVADLQFQRGLVCMAPRDRREPRARMGGDAHVPVTDHIMWLYIHSLVTSPCSGALAAEAHSTAGQTGESPWVHRQLGLPNLTPLSTSSARSEPAGPFPFSLSASTSRTRLPSCQYIPVSIIHTAQLTNSFSPWPLIPYHHQERQVEKETCSSLETQKKKNARSIYARAPAKNRNSITGLPLRHSTSTPLTDCRNIDWNDPVATKDYLTTNNRHMLPPCCLMNSPYES